MSSTALLLIASFSGGTLYEQMTLAAEFPGNNAHPAALVWPEKCKERSYCDEKPTYYPEKIINMLLANVSMKYILGDIEHRDGINDQDVGRCQKIREVRKIYLIKDRNDEIRFVAQTNKFEIKMVVEECGHPGRLNNNNTRWLSKAALKKTRVDCTEKMVPFQFPVLSVDEKTLQSEAPKDGISLSCSAKVLN